MHTYIHVYVYTWRYPVDHTEARTGMWGMLGIHWAWREPI